MRQFRKNKELKQVFNKLKFRHPSAGSPQETADINEGDIFCVVYI
jgi:hypothetical protein